MQGRFIFQWATILCFFVVALIMELAPWPAGFQAFKPSWLVLVLLYWTLALPDRVSIGWAFLLGLLWDIVLGSILGVHALVLSVAFYFVSKYYLMLRNLSLWFQSLLVLLFVFAIQWLFSWLNYPCMGHFSTGRKSLVPSHQVCYGHGFSY